MAWRSVIATTAIRVDVVCECCGKPYSYQRHIWGSSSLDPGGLLLGAPYETLENEAREKLTQRLTNELVHRGYLLRRCPHCQHVQSWMQGRYQLLRKRWVRWRIGLPTYLGVLLAIFVLACLIAAAMGPLGAILLLSPPLLAVFPTVMVCRKVRGKLGAAIAPRDGQTQGAVHLSPSLSLEKPRYEPGAVAEDEYLRRFEYRRFAEQSGREPVSRDQFRPVDRAAFPHRQWRCSVCGTVQRGKPGRGGEARAVFATPILWLLGPFILLIALWAYHRWKDDVRCVMCGMRFSPNDIKNLELPVDLTSNEMHTARENSLQDGGRKLGTAT